MSSSTTGSGDLAYRIVIEGYAESWVTHQSMENAAVDPKRYHGLAIRNAKIKHISNPLTMESEVTSFVCSVADLHGHATASFARRPSLRTWLTTDATTAAATFLVRGTAGWATSGTFWINSEAISYTAAGTSGGSPAFLGCSRAQYSTQLQKHYVTTGGYQRYPEVTDTPVTMAGRRAWVYKYEQNDNPQGDGTLYWRGIITKDPTFDGKAWTFAIEPLTVLLERSVAADQANPLTPRGVYYPEDFAFSFIIVSDAPGGTTPITISGFFENNQAFVDAVNAAIAASSSDATNDAEVRLVADGDASWHVRKLNGTSPATIKLNIQGSVRGWDYPLIDPVFNEWPTDGTPLAEQVEGPGDPDTAYFWLPAGGSAPGAGSVPRGYFGYTVGPGSTGGDPDSAPSMRLYLGGTFDPTGITAVQVAWEELGDFTGVEQFMTIVTVNTTDRYIDLNRPASASAGDTLHGFTAATLPEIRFGRDYTSDTAGNLGDYLNAIIDLVPNGLNAGAVPPLRAADFEANPVTDIFASTTDRIVNARRYTSFGAANLMDVIKPECLLAGYGVGLNSTGQIRFYLVQPPVAGSILTGTATTDLLVIDQPTGDPTWQAQMRGTANQVTILRGYRSSDDDYGERPIPVRDVAAFGQSPRPYTIKIEPKSFCFPPEGLDEAVLAARRIFALFAYPYAAISVGCDRRYGERAHGDVVYVTSNRIPDSATGTMGVTDLPMLVTGFEKGPYAAEIRLHGIAVSATLSGYVPEFQILSETNVSGNTWDLTLDVGSYAAGDYFAADYGVRVWEFDGTGTPVIGDVISVTGAVVRVTFSASAAAITSGTWVLGWRSGVDGLQPGQYNHAYLADSSGFIDDGADGQQAKVFS